jgi:hypothetical protein
MMDDTTKITLSDIECTIDLNIRDKKCNIQCNKSIGQLKRVSDIIKYILNLIWPKHN